MTGTAVIRNIQLRAILETSILRDFRLTSYWMVDWREKEVCRLYVEATNLTDTRYCDMGGILLRTLDYGRHDAYYRKIEKKSYFCEK